MGLSRSTIKSIAVKTGYPVVEAWVGGHGTMGSVYGVVKHHTATSNSAAGDYPSLDVIRYGRSDLPGPLAQYGLGRSGTIYLITEGIAYHAGEGDWKGVTDGNGHFLGIEAESDGKTWQPGTIDCYPRLVASILIAVGQGSGQAPRHAEWANPPGRKVDTSGLDEAWQDQMINHYLAHPDQINKNISGGDDMTPDECRTVVRSEIQNALGVILTHNSNSTYKAAPHDQDPTMRTEKEVNEMSEAMGAAAGSVATAAHRFGEALKDWNPQPNPPTPTP